MKKITYILVCAAAAVAAASCSKTEQNVSNSDRVDATINATIPSTKVTIDGITTSWTTGDKMTVFDLNGTSEGEFTATNSGTTAAFSGTKATEDDILMFAIYPANSAATCQSEQNKVYTSIPTVQDGSISNALIAGVSDGDDNFTFANVCSVLKLTITDTDITTITFVSTSTLVPETEATYEANPIAGDVAVNCADPENIALEWSDLDGAKQYSSIMIKNADGSALTPGDKYIALYPGTYEGTLVFGKKDGSVRYAAGINFNSREFAQNKIRNFGTANFTWVPNAIAGVFSLGNDTRVLFAQGNIMYQTTTATWKINDTYESLYQYNTEATGYWIEHFNWNNANTPDDVVTDYAKVAGERGYWDEEGDWSKKVGDGKWEIFDINQISYLFDFGKDLTRSAKAKVGQAVGIVKLDGRFYTVVYPDGWTGEYFSKTAYPTSDNVTAEELEALQDLGCMVLSCGGHRARSTAALQDLGKVGQYWTCTWKSGSNETRGVASAARFIYTGATPSMKEGGLESDRGFLVRPYYPLETK